MGRFAEMMMKLEGSSAAGFETLCKGSAGGIREELLCSPKCDGRGASTGALEGDLTEVKIL